MTTILPKQQRLRLLPDAYREMHRQVLERDGWECQLCGAMSNLEVHHIRFRSHSGDDSEQNLITLCAACHASKHKARPMSRI
jgi:5-methylcytosine-specific restriction endonuclease McrA